MDGAFRFVMVKYHTRGKPKYFIVCTETFHIFLCMTWAMACMCIQCPQFNHRKHDCVDGQNVGAVQPAAPVPVGLHVHVVPCVLSTITVLAIWR